MDTAWKHDRPYFTALLVFMPKISDEHTTLAQHGVTASLTASITEAKSPLRPDGMPVAAAVLTLDHQTAGDYTEADLEIYDDTYKTLLTSTFEALINFIPPLPYTAPAIN